MQTIRIPSIQLDISPTELAQLRGKMTELILLDVRSAREVEQGAIPGAHHLPLPLLLDRVHQAPIATVDRPLLVYCRSGKRSLTACRLLAEEGYQRLYNLVGGFEAYRQAQLPVATIL